MSSEQPPPPSSSRPNNPQKQQHRQKSHQRHPPHPQGSGRQGPQAQSNHQQHQAPPQAISLNPKSGIPYGHVPAYLPGSASLIEQLDQRVLIVLRDGKHLIGTFSSFDQFSNMVLEDAIERRLLKDGPTTYYADIPLGIYVVRGDSMVLLGTVFNNGTDASLRELSLQDLEAKEEEILSKQEDTTNNNGDDESVTWDFDADLIA